MDGIDVMKEYYDALVDDRIEACYQPVFNVDERTTLVSAEALCRIRLKNGMLLMPDKFIPILEQTGEICTLDWIMLDKACMTVLDIVANTDSDFVIAVNFSRAHVNEWDTVERMCSIVDSYCLDHDHIEIEITETYKVDDFMINFLMKRLKSEGFRVAVDDFGEGYNSHKLIQKADFDTIKIDRSIVQNTGIDNSDAIIHGILEMANALGVRTIAEGVENSRHAANMVAHGCKNMQGNYLMKPIPEEEFIGFIHNEEKRAGGEYGNEIVLA